MNVDVKKKYDTYPDHVRKRLFEIRELIFEVAEIDKAGKVTETLKWGEPSYLAKKGSTIRVDWKQKSSDRISIYFNCKTILIETFREIFGDCFQFVGNREMVLPVACEFPTIELKVCISMSLRYHDIKHLPLLGA